MDWLDDGLASNVQLNPAANKLALLISRTDDADDDHYDDGRRILKPLASLPQIVRGFPLSATLLKGSRDGEQIIG